MLIAKAGNARRGDATWRIKARARLGSLTSSGRWRGNGARAVAQALWVDKECPEITESSPEQSVSEYRVGFVDSRNRWGSAMTVVMVWQGGERCGREKE
jgi:hypothetical protein